MRLSTSHMPPRARRVIPDSAGIAVDSLVADQSPREHAVLYEQCACELARGFERAARVAKAPFVSSDLASNGVLAGPDGILSDTAGPSRNLPTDHRSGIPHRDRDDHMVRIRPTHERPAHLSMARERQAWPRSPELRLRRASIQRLIWIS